MVKQCIHSHFYTADTPCLHVADTVMESFPLHEFLIGDASIATMFLVVKFTHVAKLQKPVFMYKASPDSRLQGVSVQLFMSHMFELVTLRSLGASRPCASSDRGRRRASHVVGWTIRKFRLTKGRSSYDLCQGGCYHANQCLCADATTG